MNIYYNGKILRNGDFLKVSETQIKPQIVLNVENNSKYYTILLHDPNAIVGDKIHWCVINIINNDINKGLEIHPYQGPAPPPKTGIHNYIFELYEQSDKINPNSIDKSINEYTYSMFKKKLNINLCSPEQNNEYSQNANLVCSGEYAVNNKPLYQIKFISKNSDIRRTVTSKKKGGKRRKKTYKRISKRKFM